MVEQDASGEFIMFQVVSSGRGYVAQGEGLQTKVCKSPRKALLLLEQMIAKHEASLEGRMERGFELMEQYGDMGA
jgi:hypothetical protein